MGRLRIRLLGGLEIAGSNDAGAPVLSRKAKALLAYLALHLDQPQSREKLAALLWQDSPEEQARTNLRQVLLSIRKALDDYEVPDLVADRDRISLIGRNLDLDVTEFERLVAEATPSALNTAAALYKGDLLDGFSLKEDTFEAWARAERERLRQLAANVMTELTAHYDAIGDATHCVETATRLLNLDPLREAAHRILMRTYAAQGRHASALKQFEVCRKILNHELSVEPEPETVALYRSIRKQRALASNDKSASVENSEPDCPPLPNGQSPATDRPTKIVPAAGRISRWPIVGLVVLIVVIGAVLWHHSQLPRVEPTLEANMAFPLPDKPSIAVLPFANMSGDSEQEYFVDGMTEDLITDLSKISGLFVIARNSSFSYKGQQIKIRQVAEDLGVRYVLKGSVRRAGEQIRINTQLIDATTGGHIWAERYDGTLDDVFAFQDSVTREIANALAVALTDEETVERTHHETDHAQAHDAFLRGWAYYKLLTPEDLARAIPFFEEAIRLDPNYARAHAALASLYWDAFRNNWAYDLDMPSFRAERLANEHLDIALKTPNTLAHVVQARIFAYFGFYDEALEEARQSISLDVNDATAEAGLAYAYVLADQAGDAIKPIRTAMRLDPHHAPSYLITLGAAQFGLERFEDAVVTFERAVKSNPQNELPGIYLASARGHLGHVGKAEMAIKAVNEVRFEQGLGELSLRDPADFPYRVVDRRHGQIDFSRFGKRSVQERVRAGLVEIPALTWQYRITWIRSMGGSETISLEIEGAAEVDIEEAKALYDRGAVFIDASSPETFKKQRISESVNLPYYRSLDPTQKYFTQEALLAVAEKSQEIVLFCERTGCLYPAWVTAKAANWGYQKIFFFKGGTEAWVEAGYFVERGE
jgi:TolB-like protein/DNA-binding SARP family transcriptional activator